MINFRCPIINGKKIELKLEGWTTFWGAWQEPEQNNRQPHTNNKASRSVD